MVPTINFVYIIICVRIKMKVPCKSPSNLIHDWIISSEEDSISVEEKGRK